MDQRPLQLAPQMALEPAQALAVDGRLAVAAGRLLAQVQRAANALDVHADHAGALSLAAERGHRQACQVGHLTVAALPDRVLDLAAQLIQVDALAAVESL